MLKVKGWLLQNAIPFTNEEHLEVRIVGPLVYVKR